MDLATAHYLPGGDRVLDSAYDRFGERRELKLIQGAKTLTHTWSFDALGRLDLASFPGSSPLDFTPFADDTLERITHASGATTDYSYYPQGPIETITLKAGGTTQRNHLGYTVNGVQNITQLSEQHASSDPTESYLYGYDGADRLTSADYPAAYGLPADESFGYDPAGNREDPADPNLYAYDANNRIAASPGPLAYGFDADGNLTSKTGETFGYDFTNRLTSFTGAGTAAAYAYDPFGRRIRKIETVSGVTTWYLWDGDQLLAEYDATGARTVRYAYAGGFAPAQVAYKDGSGEDVYDVHTDHLDTPRLLTDDTGTVVWREAHEAFGKAVVDPDPDGDLTEITFNIRFPGQYFDVESGLQYNRFRYYDAAVGRYISADPIGQAAETNIYSYAISNPTTSADPTGLFGFGALTFGGAFVGAVGGAGFEIGRQLGRFGSIDNLDAVLNSAITGGLLGGAIGFAADTYGLATGSYVTGLTLSYQGQTVTVGLYSLINGSAAVVGSLGFVTGVHAGKFERDGTIKAVDCEGSSTSGSGSFASGGSGPGQVFFGFMGGLNTAGL